MKAIEKKKIKIRSLKVADRKRLSSMIEKLAKTVGDSSLLNMISSTVSRPEKGTKESDNAQQNTVQVGIKILQVLLKTLEQETQDWFADLIGVTPEEFNELPIDTELIIIRQIVEAEESSSFFTIASQLYKKIEWFQNKFGEAKKKYDTKIG